MLVPAGRISELLVAGNVILPFAIPHYGVGKKRLFHNLNAMKGRALERRIAIRDAPMVLAGPRPNTATGHFRVKKGRVQMEKPEGVVAISGDVVVGGQGFNNCLFWKSSHQLKETVNITLLHAGNSGVAYLHLNGCKDKAASLTMTANNKVLTDSGRGEPGELIIKSLTIAGKAMPADTYTATTEKWIDGRGRVVVAP